MIYYDRNGNTISQEAFVAIFGDLPILENTTDAWAVAYLQEMLPSSTLLVKVKDLNGKPMEDIPVAWWWPDVKQAHDAVFDVVMGKWCIRGVTNAMGEVGFGMGDGAYYWPDKGQLGPHQVWIFGHKTPLIQGLGMVAATNHQHPDIGIVVRSEEPPEPPPDECPVKEVLDLCGDALLSLEEARQKVLDIQTLMGGLVA